MNAANVDRLTSQSLSEAVRDRLLRLIVRGDLRPGARLNEVHLAESFGISRGPIREAARELEGQGFLFSRPNQGFFVVDFTPAEIRDIYEAKDWMEAAFVSDIAAHTPIPTRAAILTDINAIDASDRGVFSETLFQFRLRVTAHIRNRFLADLMVALYRKFYIVSAIVRVGEEPSRLERILSVQRKFWIAMAENEIDRARAILRDDTLYWLTDLPHRFPAREPSTQPKMSSAK